MIKKIIDLIKLIYFLHSNVMKIRRKNKNRLVSNYYYINIMQQIKFFLYLFNNQTPIV